MWGQIAQAALQVGEAFMGAHSAHKANRTNIMLARENRDWQERMANSEISRRADDIERAGGNRALAFTNGQGASSPSVASPTVEPTFRANGQASQIALTAAQLARNKAEIRNIDQQTATGRANEEAIRASIPNYAHTAAQLQAQTANLEQARENLKEELKGIIAQNTLRDLDAKLKGATMQDAVRIVTEELRKLRAEATSAEKKALLDEAVINFIQWAQRKANQIIGGGKLDLKPTQPILKQPNFKGPAKHNRNPYIENSGY